MIIKSQEDATTINHYGNTTVAFPTWFQQYFTAEINHLEPLDLYISQIKGGKILFEKGKAYFF